MLPYKLNPFGIYQYVPLTLLALQDNSTVKMTVSAGSPTVAGLQFCRRGQAWGPYTIDSVISLKTGQYVQFRNTADTLNSSGNTVKFILTGKFQAVGDLMSMLSNNGACKTLCFNSLFASNNSLYSCQQLLFPKVLANSCLQTMFQWCQYLYKGPRKLPATNLAQGCYGYMFQGCQHLEYMPILPATVSARWAYRYMFQYGGMWNSAGMITTPIQFTSLADYSCQYMFQNAKIDTLQVNFTQWTGTDSTTNWVSGVPATGTFIKPLSLSPQEGANRIPSGWAVINK